MIRTDYPIRDYETGEVIAVHRVERSDDDPTQKDVHWIDKEGRPGLDGRAVNSLPLYWGGEIPTSATDQVAFLCEGEKSAQALTDSGYLAAGTVTGAASHPSREMLVILRNVKRVYLWPDNDGPGRGHMGLIAKELWTLGVPFSVIEWAQAPNKGDAADAVAAGVNVDDLIEQADPQPAWIEKYITGTVPEYDSWGLSKAYLKKAALARKAKAEGKQLKPHWPWRELDIATDGGIPVGITTLHAGTNVGKTALMLQVATEAGCPAIYVTCEMRPEELMRRSIARITGTPRRRLMNATLSAEEEEELVKLAAPRLDNLHIIDAGVERASPAYLNELVRHYKAQHEFGHCIVIIDSLDVWAYSFGKEMAEQFGGGNTIESGIDQLNTLAMRNDICVIAIQERAKANAGSSDMYSAAGSRAAPYRSHLSFALDAERDKDGNPEPRNGCVGVPVILKLNKSREGEAFVSFRLDFIGDYMDFKLVDIL